MFQRLAQHTRQLRMAAIATSRTMSQSWLLALQPKATMAKLKSATAR